MSPHAHSEQYAESLGLAVFYPSSRSSTPTAALCSLRSMHTTEIPNGFSSELSSSNIVPGDPFAAEDKGFAASLIIARWKKEKRKKTF